MSHLNQTLVKNFFDAASEYSARRELKAPASEKQFWIGRTASNEAASRLTGNGHALELILNLRRKHCGNPLFATLCQNLK